MKLMGTDVITPADLERELKIVLGRLEAAEQKLVTFAKYHLAATIGGGVALVILVAHFFH